MLRLSVPDFDTLVQIYTDNRHDLDTMLYPLMGSHCNKFDIHKSVFNEKKLTDLLMASGFWKVRRWQPDSTDITTFGDWSSKKVTINSKSYLISLNIEAIKVDRAN